MSQQAKMQVAVSVATVWTSPDSPRPMDEPALQNPADIRGWLDRQTIEDRLDLCNANRVQTQALLGTEVIVLEQSGDWAKVCIPEQRTRHHEYGYPGWIPLRQLAAPPDYGAGTKWAEVASFRATMLSIGGSELELSYLTRLPVIGEPGEADATVRVGTPAGEGLLSRSDVRIISGPSGEKPSADAGKRIAEQAGQFIGLPYLWGGMSSFGFDCSGFTYQLHRSQGIAIPRDASDQALGGEEIPRGGLEPGDLLFFAHDEGKGRIHHVCLYIGNGSLIHSPDSRSAVETVRMDEFKLMKEHCVSRRYWSWSPVNT